MMGKIKIIMLLCLTVLLGSCVEEDLIRSGNVAEGESAIISVSLKGAQMGSGAKSRALTSEDEKKINNIHVLIFNNKDELVTNMHFDSYNSGIVVPTYSGNNRTIYVVANGDAHTNIDKNLIRVKLRADLDAIVVENSVHDLQRTNGLIMAGEIKVDIIPGTSSLSPIQLSYLSAKVTLKVIDATPEGQSVQILGWDVFDASAKGFLNDKGTDAVNPDTPADFFTTNGKYQFETKNEVEKSATQEMYLFENRRGGRVDKALPDDESKRYKGMNVNDKNDKGKAWYAPDRATYISIYAMHNQDASTKQILAKIYIGNDNNSDYNIARSNHYTFTVTVNGLDSIKIDSNVEYQDGGLRVDYGTNLLMDTHYDFRPIRLQAAKGVATIEILDSKERHYDDLNFDATWLKVSPINLMNVQIYQNPDNSSMWQEIAGENRFSRPKYIPHKSVRQELMNKGGWNTVPADYLDDNVLPFAHSTYRMCYKITDIEFPNPAVATPQIFQVYADENIKSTDQRTAYIQVRYTKDGFGGAQEQETLLITQEGRLSIFPNSDDVGLYQLDASGMPVGNKQRFAIERREEPALVLNPGIGLNFQQTEVMQWGFPGEILYDEANKYRNGQFLTANAVFKDKVVSLDANGLPEWELESSDYRSVYGNSGAAIPNYVGTGQAPPYYLPVPDKDKVYHPIYNSSAARYCFEKNRDRNGDGKIDQSEAVWYLPSRDEMLMILVANSEDIDNTFPSIGYGMFWTSTQRTPYKEIVKGKPTDRLLYDTYAVGPAFGFAPSTGGDSPFRVRCIRNIPLP